MLSESYFSGVFNFYCYFSDMVITFFMILILQLHVLCVTICEATVIGSNYCKKSITLKKCESKKVGIPEKPAISLCAFCNVQLFRFCNLPSKYFNSH